MKTNTTPEPQGQPTALRCDAIVRLSFDAAVRIARGCLDYGGGYRGDNGKMEIFHHGIQTVINSLEAAQKRGLQDTQVAALHAMGKPNAVVSHTGAFPDSRISNQVRSPGVGL